MVWRRQGVVQLLSGASEHNRRTPLRNIQIKRDRIRFLFPSQPAFFDLIQPLTLQKPVKFGFQCLPIHPFKIKPLPSFSCGRRVNFGIASIRNLKLCVAPSSFATCRFTPSHTISIIPTDPFVRLIRCSLILTSQDNHQTHQNEHR